MLKQLKIKNFQNHKDSVLNFHQNVNKICGSSNEGKTTTFRSEELILKNRPSGYGYKPYTAKKKDITEVTNIFDDGEVIRRRGDTIDEYEFNGEKFTALNRQTPSEIKDFLNIADYQFQDQHSAHFFISQTPGERAKLLNEISGLEIIDRSIANVNSIIKKNTADLKQNNESIKDLESKIGKISFIKEAEEILVQIELLFTEYEQLEIENKKLKEYCDELKEVESKISELNEFLKVKPLYQVIVDCVSETNELNVRNTQLYEYVKNIENLTEVIDSNKDFLKVKGFYKELNVLFSEYYELLSKTEELQKYIDSVKEIEQTIETTKEWLGCKDIYAELMREIDSQRDLEQKNSTLLEYVQNTLETNSRALNSEIKLTALKKKKEDYLKEMKICPLCNSEIK